jgi:hypothetical protein
MSSSPRSHQVCRRARVRQGQARKGRASAVRVLDRHSTRRRWTNAAGTEGWLRRGPNKRMGREGRSGVRRQDHPLNSARRPIWSCEPPIRVLTSLLHGSRTTRRRKTCPIWYQSHDEDCAAQHNKDDFFRSISDRSPAPAAPMLPAHSWMPPCPSPATSIDTSLPIDAAAERSGALSVSAMRRDFLCFSY